MRRICMFVPAAELTAPDSGGFAIANRATTAPRPAGTPAWRASVMDRG
jgi:hypothetical protein